MAVQIPDPSARLSLEDGRPSQAWYGILAKLTRLLNSTEATVGDASSGLGSKLSQGKHTIWVPAAAMTPIGSPSGAATATFTSNAALKEQYTVLAFDDTTQEFASFAIAMPKSWDLGTISFQPYWTTTTASAAQTVQWRLAILAFSDDDSLDTSHSSFGSVTDTVIAQRDLHVGSESGAITPAGSPQAGDMLNFRAERSVANDNATGDALLIGVKIFYTVDKGNDA